MMKLNFKVGDTVVCIDDEDSDLSKGSKYVVKEIAEYDDSTSIPEIYLEGIKFSWMQTRFKLAEDIQNASDKRVEELENALQEILSVHANDNIRPKAFYIASNALDNK